MRQRGPEKQHIHLVSSSTLVSLAWHSFSLRSFTDQNLFASRVGVYSWD